MYIDLETLTKNLKLEESFKLDITIENELGESVVLYSHDFEALDRDELMEVVETKLEDFTGLLYYKLQEDE